MTDKSHLNAANEALAVEQQQRDESSATSYTRPTTPTAPMTPTGTSVRRAMGPTRRQRMSVIARLPLQTQVTFRRKVLGIFALQLAIVWVVTGVWAYDTQANDFLSDHVVPHKVYVLIPLALGLVLLGVLHCVRKSFPWNWLIFIVFTLTQSVLFAALGAAFDSNLGFYNAGALFCCVLIKILLAGVRRRKLNKKGKEVEVLLGSVQAGIMAFVIVALAAGGLFIGYGTEFVTAEGFGLSLLLQLLLLLWFVFNAADMYRVLSPDEAIEGVIHFYTDIVLLVISTAMIAGIAVVAVAWVTGKGSCDDCATACEGCALTGADDLDDDDDDDEPIQVVLQDSEQQSMARV